MRDIIEKIGEGSLIHHGSLNNRIYLMKLHKEDTKNIIELLENLARKNSYTKLICKIPKSVAPIFFAESYLLEAFIPKFYNSREDMFFVSKFITQGRFLDIEKNQLNTLNNIFLEATSEVKTTNNYTDEYTLRKLNASDVDQITQLYREVFESYPFPIHNPGYILKTMKDNVQYYGVEKFGNIVAIASAEVDFDSQNAEMTDFATHPDHKGKSLSKRLLSKLEEAMKKQNITTLYTIARLNSVPMNKTFIRYNYIYTGTLRRNSNIAGQIESMNIYYKHL